MDSTISRRRFLGGMAATAGYLGLNPTPALWAHTEESLSPAKHHSPQAKEYETFIKLCFNENPYGPSEPVMKAMTQAFKYASRYEAPDGNIIEAIAAHHGVQPENVMIGAGSTEILDVIASTFLQDHKKVVGADPTYKTVYQWALGLQSESICIPLLPDHHQDIPMTIKAAQDNHREVGLVYLCNPNNPTGVIIPQQQVKQLLDALPEGMPVLIDEAYHHYVDNVDYSTSIQYVLENRPVIVARTFSKISGLAGLRLGYCIAPKNIIEQMRPHISAYNVNAIVKWGGVAALQDTKGQAYVRNITLKLRAKTTAQLQSYGYSSIPSDTNFFMVHIGQPVVPVIQAFRERKILVGRPFPPMLDYLRVSIGTAEEMQHFMTAFKQIFPQGTTAL